ncbi:glycosyltransferase [Phycicoccus sp.]|uniref:glycosyltransferase n=1 Tax=Phycicoccus sp. TaxID=1902410 RepID=UPI002BB27716|nr:glycosyltransferase [Phycicoccus sp.]HMM95396.1 glycosyltransferase [Phycicoccus sp.]
MSTVTVVVTSIPPRGRMLGRALESVARQTRPADAIVAVIDHHREGAALNRDNGLSMVTTDYVAFLDDDDELYPDHLARLLAAAAETGADLVYPWFDVGSGGTDPFPQFEGAPWDPAEPHQIPVTFLARTVAVHEAGGFSFGWDTAQSEDPGVDEHGNRAGEDYRLVVRMNDRSAKIHHLPARTWVWHHHGANTSGLPSRW